MSAFHPLADSEVESIAFSLDQCCVTIMAYVSEGILSTALMGVDLFLDPPASMSVFKGHTFGVANTDIVAHSKFFDEQ